MQSLTVLQQKTKAQRVVLVDLRYPYGKNKVYMSGLVAVNAQLTAAGHQVNHIDLNLDRLDEDSVESLLSKAQIIGMSVIGSPYYNQAIKLCQRFAEQYPHAKVLVGGQPIIHLDKSEFRRIFGKRAVQIVNHDDCVAVFGELGTPYEVPFQPVWERMGDERLKRYLEGEFSLVLSQGCIFGCGFCGADKNVPEKHRNLEMFTSDMQYLRKKAEQFGLPGLECYASSLDFFQNPEVVFRYMGVLGKVFGGENPMPFRVRALCCMNTFLKAARMNPERFAELVQSCHLWCVGFGVDGADEEMWKAQNKLQNKIRDIYDCLDLCEKLGLRTEVLMVMGYPTDTIAKLYKTVRNSLYYVRKWSRVMLRPYLAKTLIPGNLGWEIYPAIIEKLIANPKKFYNLDFCAVASPLTHPRIFQRWLCNFSYLLAIAVLSPFGRCCTNPLLPARTGRAVWRNCQNR
jgi:hypothetical protein